MKILQNRNIVKTSLLVAAFAVASACGYSSKNNAPVAGAMPAIMQLSPDIATAGGGPFTLVVNGSNFSTKAVLNWNNVAQTANTTYVSANQLSVAIPASLIEAAGTVSVSVTNPATPGTGTYGTGATLAATSQPADFTIN